MTRTIRPDYNAPARLAYVNKVIQQYHRLPVELVRGDGYHYFIWDDESIGAYEDESVMVPYTSHQTLGRWVQEAQAFYADAKARYEERAAIDNGQFGVGA